MKCILFRGMNEAELSQMLGCISPHTADFIKGELMFEAGGPMKYIAVVLTGTVAITKETPLGERMVLNKISAGGIFGEVAALSDAQRSPASIYALENSRVLFLSPQSILTSCEKVCPWHSRLIANLVHLVAGKALYLNRKIDYLTIRSMRGKLCTYLYEQYRTTGNTKFTLQYNRNELAEFFNVSRPSMSRELGRMRDEGIISFSGDTFELLDRKALEAFVQ